MARGDLKVVDGGGHKPTAAPAPVEPPPWLSAEAREVWAALAPRTAAGTLTPATAWTFALLCVEFSTYVEAEQLVQEAGLLIADGQNLVPNPALQLRRQADGIAGRWAAQFGLTPASARGTGESERPRQLPHLVEG